MSTRLYATVFRFGILVCCGTVAACDSPVHPRSLSAPLGAPALNDAPSLPPGTTAALTIPRENYPKFGEVDWTDLPAPESVWARVSVQGSINVSTNPYFLELFNRRAEFDGLTVGPEGHPDQWVALDLALAVRVHNSVGEYLRFGASGTEGESRITFIPKGGRLRWHRTGISGVTMCLSVWCDPPGFSGDVPHYVLDGAQTIQVQPVPVPLRVVPDRQAVAKGDTVQFTGEEDIRMVSSSRRWFWVRDDTLARPHEVANPFGDGRYVFIRQCSGMAACDYAPPGSGRMHHTASPNGIYIAHASSPVLQVKQEQLELECNGAQDSVRINRTDELTCEASGATDILGWEFRADDSGYRNPAEGATPFKGTRWKGPVVLSGTVTVKARVAGGEESKSVRVGVSARDWSDREMAREAEEEPAPLGEMPTKPDTVRQLGHIHPVLTVALSRDKWEPILSGPNANLAYLRDLPIAYRGTIHVNRAALAVGSEFWNAQPVRPPRNSDGVVHCLRREEDILGFIPVILRHEGVGFDPKSHAYLYVEEAERVGNPEFERVVGSSLQELMADAMRITDVVGAAADISSARADAPGYRPAWCRFDYTYNGR